VAEEHLRQPVIARLEIGEHTPSLTTLAKLTSYTGSEFPSLSPAT
jgi:hypothetical protein